MSTPRHPDAPPVWDTAIPGCFVVAPPVHRDDRGIFVKPLAPDLVDQVDPSFEVAEIFWSTSHRGVLRGMHYQRDPAGVAKLVWCTSGRILDVVVDLRRATRGTVVARELSPSEGTAMFVPHGCAHGFLALEHSVVVYAQSGAFSPEHDTGVHWRSIGFDWPELTSTPIVSARDDALPGLGDVDAID